MGQTNCDGGVANAPHIEKKFKTVEEFIEWYEKRKKDMLTMTVNEQVHRIFIEEAHYGIYWEDDEPNKEDKRYMLISIRDMVHQREDLDNFINKSSMFVSPAIAGEMRKEVKKLVKIQKAKEELYMYLFGE